MVIMVYLSSPLIRRHLVTDSGERLQPEGLQQERLQPEGLHQEGLHQEGEMVRTPGVLEAEEEALEEFASTSGLSALNQGHTSPTHMETNTEPGVKALGTVTARLPPRPDRTSKKSLKQMVIVLYLSCPLLGRHLYKDSGDLEMPADHGNQHVVVRQHPIDAVIVDPQPGSTGSHRPARCSRDRGETFCLYGLYRTCGPPEQLGNLGHA
ncbi:uncharacterized protein LOC130405109 [Gadus chalcogrammus]|uniref:uncharacterized protein LOC130405109 n=1 Tax=Gadus chalcogrammus TaxID=1042646 RepID=UPI0024C4D7A2|nr:uncharacterized protein LOC130405109 [Gadus chalcogrammus]